MSNTECTNSGRGFQPRWAGTWHHGQSPPRYRLGVKRAARSWQAFGVSHFISIQTQIKHMAALRAACQELGVELIENAVARGYGSNTHRGEYVIKPKGPYDIAINRQPDGSTYGLTCDWWDGHVEKEVGSQYGRLLHLYAVHKATREARRKSLTGQRTLRTDGSIKLTIGGL